LRCVVDARKPVEPRFCRILCRLRLKMARTPDAYKATRAIPTVLPTDRYLAMKNPVYLKPWRLLAVKVIRSRRSVPP